MSVLEEQDYQENNKLHRMLSKAFNHGYKMQRDKPKFAKKLSKCFPNKEHPYAEGFLSGMKEYTQERRQIELLNDRFLQEQRQLDQQQRSRDY